VGHHWRTKCALSGNQGGEGNGLAELAGVVEGGVEPKVGGKVDTAVNIGVEATIDSDTSGSAMASSVLFDTSGKLSVAAEALGSPELGAAKRGIQG
jgi:hypothetical protein